MPWNGRRGGLAMEWLGSWVWRRSQDDVCLWCREHVRCDVLLGSFAKVVRSSCERLAKLLAVYCWFVEDVGGQSKCSRKPSKASIVRMFSGGNL